MILQAKHRLLSARGGIPPLEKPGIQKPKRIVDLIGTSRSSFGKRYINCFLMGEIINADTNKNYLVILSEDAGFLGSVHYSEVRRDLYITPNTFRVFVVNRVETGPAGERFLLCASSSFKTLAEAKEKAIKLGELLETHRPTQISWLRDPYDDPGSYPKHIYLAKDKGKLKKSDRFKWNTDDLLAMAADFSYKIQRNVSSGNGYGEPIKHPSSTSDGSVVLPLGHIGSWERAKYDPNRSVPTAKTYKELEDVLVPECKRLKVKFRTEVSEKNRGLALLLYV